MSEASGDFIIYIHLQGPLVPDRIPYGSDINHYEVKKNCVTTVKKKT